MHLELDEGWWLWNQQMSYEERKASTQLAYIVGTRLKGQVRDKVHLAGRLEGGRLWQLLLQEYEPRLANRTNMLHRSILRYKIEGKLTSSLENFEKLVQEYEEASQKTLEADTKAPIVLNQLAVHPEESTRQLCNHIVLNGD